MSEETVDVLIIGAGASGAALAWSLAETRMNVLCLEQGGWMNPAEYPTAGMDWELRRFSDFGLSPNSRGRREDYPINDEASPIAVSNFNAVGGSTILYAAHFPRFRPGDFRVRTLDGVAEDWPVSYAELEPWYDENARMMGVAGNEVRNKLLVKPEFSVDTIKHFFKFFKMLERWFSHNFEDIGRCMLRRYF